MSGLVCDVWRKKTRNGVFWIFVGVSCYFFAYLFWLFWCFYWKFVVFLLFLSFGIWVVGLGFSGLLGLVALFSDGKTVLRRFTSTQGVFIGGFCLPKKLH